MKSFSAIVFILLSQSQGRGKVHALASRNKKPSSRTNATRTSSRNDKNTTTINSAADTECLPTDPQHEHFYCHTRARRTSTNSTTAARTAAALHQQVCQDSHPECSYWAQQRGECTHNPRYMLLNCRRSCRTCWEDLWQQHQLQSAVQLAPPPYESVIANWIQQDTAEYLATVVHGNVDLLLDYHNYDNLDSIQQHKCFNQHELCTYWAAVHNGCHDNTWMQRHCGPACRSCHSRTVE